MKQLLTLATVWLFLLPLAAAAAPGLDYLGIEHDLAADRSAVVKLTLRFDPPTDSFEYRLPYRIANLSVEATFPNPDCIVSDQGSSTIVCRLREMTLSKNQLVLSYNVPAATGISPGAAVFAASYPVPMPAKNAFVLVQLPPNTFLARDIANQSFSPASGSTLTDGRRISVYWDYTDLTAGSTLSLQTLYSLPEDQPSDYLIPAVALLAILAVAIASFLTHRYTKRRAGSAVAAVLSPDERRIVDLLHGKGGKSLQKQLVRETDFSKAKVSRLVNSLQARHVVSVEAVSGRENRIVLKLGSVPKPESAPKPAQKENDGPPPAEA